MLDLLTLFLSFIFSAIVTMLMIPRIILISYKKTLFDVVDQRKVHQGVVPRLGGVAFAPAMIISFALLFGLATLTKHNIMQSAMTAQHLALGLCSLLLLYFEGVTDDLVGVGYKTKFVVQILCAVLIVASGIWIDNLYGLFGLYEIPAWAGMPLSVVLMVYIINAVNLIDGIDGLASGLSIVALFFLGSLFANRSYLISASVAFAMLGALVPFFFYNVFGRSEHHNKIFMGDCGSQVVGLVLGYLAVWFCMSSETRIDKPILENSLVVAFSLMMIPCLDVIRVMMGRIRRGKNPFLPDKTHIHHKFLALGMSHRTAMLTILMIDAFFALLNLSFADVININILLAADIFLWCAMHVWISKLIAVRSSAQQET